MNEPRQPQIEACPACGASIIWAMDGLAKRVPVDADPSPLGDMSLGVNWDGQPRVRRPAAKLAFGRTNLHRLHTATCTRLRVLKLKTGI